MEIAIRNIFHPTTAAERLFGILAVVMLISVGLTFWFDLIYLLALPAVFLLLYVVCVDFRQIYFLLIASIPLSTELNFAGGLATDLPVEALTVGLMGIYFLYIAKHGRSIDPRYFVHTITVILFLHVFWIFLTTVTSSLWLVSLKFLLAKIWYVVVGYFMTGLLIRRVKDFKKLFWFFFISLMATVLITLVRHAAYGFSFEFVFRVLHPFYRNHVAYAVTMALFFPVVALSIAWYRWYSTKWWVLVISTAILLVAIYLSYTRAAYVAILVAGVVYFIIKWRIIRYVLLAATLASVLAIGYLVHENTYLKYAPNFDRTITHTEFDNLIQATYKLEDISTMERVYRWVAGFYMFSDQPIVGFGPGNFVNFYRQFTVTSFKTYVSRNEQQSGIHSYFLMTMVEQGLVGVLLFYALCCWVLIKGESIYHQLQNPERKRIVMMMLLSTIVIDAFCIINDLIETDKAGLFFFLAMAVIVNMELDEKEESENELSLKNEVL